jgi:hypothetical protein
VGFKQQGIIMTLIETFAYHTQQEFPPTHVFCYYNGEPKSIRVDQLAEYETMYVFDKPMSEQTSLTYLDSEFHLPSLLAR